MVNLSLTELKLIAKIRAIKGYEKMSEYKLLSALNALKSMKTIIEIRKENLSLNESKLIAKIRGIEGYESMSEEKLLSALNKSEPVKTKREVRKENRDEDKIFRDLRSLFDTEKDHHEPRKIASAFNNNYIKYQSMGNKDKNLSVKEYLDVIKPYLRDITNNYKAQEKLRIHSGNTITEHETQAEWKIHLTMTSNFISFKDSKDFDKNQTIHLKSDNTEIMIGSETDKIIEELLESLLQRYQELLAEAKNGSYLVFDSVDALYYNLNEISLSRGGSYIDSPKWLKNKKGNNKSKK